MHAAILLQCSEIGAAELVKLAFCFILALTVALLHEADKFLSLTLYLVQIIVSQVTPLLLDFAFQLLPLPFCNICIHQ